MAHATTIVITGDCLNVLRTVPDASIDAVVTDPPYGLSKQPDALEVLRHWLDGDDYEHKGSGFMGKTWDSFVPGPSIWREVLRVLKPGGHACVFAGSRTVDLMGLAMRIAGFEIRDQLQWLYGTGFPKSLNVSKAIDKIDRVGPMRERALRFTAWMRSTGLTATKINDLTGTSMGSHYVTDKQQPAVPTEDLFALLRPHLPPIPDEIEELVHSRSVEAENMKRRPVLRTEACTNAPSGIVSCGRERTPFTRNVTAPATEDAKRWDGWGTALKPAHEPIILARKPLSGTIASTVLEHGTGALNIDGCRIAGAKPSTTRGAGGQHGITSPRGQGRIEDDGLGRWPANVILDPEAGAVLDQQSGITTSPKTTGRGAKRRGTDDYGMQAQGTVSAPGDTGGASRFFYTAKASRAEREAGLEHMRKASAGELTGGRAEGSAGLKNPRAGAGRTSSGRANVHPTVKPISLMRWLVRLVCPPGGVVLDPFTGSGSTACAAVQESETCAAFVGIELSPEYAEIARARIEHWRTRSPNADRHRTERHA